MHTDSAGSSAPQIPESEQVPAMRLRWSIPPIVLSLIILIAVCLVIEPSTLSPSALRSMIPFAGILAIAAVGQALVVGQGGFDFSVAGIISAAAVLVTQVSHSADPGLAAGIVVALGVSIIAGLANGLVITRLGITPLVATLATSAILIGAVLNVSDAVPVSAPPALSRFAISSTLVVPNIFWIAIVFVGIATFVLRKTVLGRRLTLTGAGARAALVAGIRSDFYVVGAYVGAAVCYWAAGVCIAGYVGNPNKGTGDPYVLMTITAVVLGGAALTGGRVNPAYTAIAGVFLVQLNQLITSLGAPVGIQYLVQAGIVAAAVLSGSARTRLRRTRVAAETGHSPRPEVGRHGNHAT